MNVFQDYSHADKNNILIESIISKKVINYLTDGKNYITLSLDNFIGQCLEKNIEYSNLMAKVLLRYGNRVFLILTRNSGGLFYKLKNILLSGSHEEQKASGIAYKGAIYINLDKVLGYGIKDINNLDKSNLINIMYIIIHELVHYVCLNSNNFQKSCSNLIMNFYYNLLGKFFSKDCPLKASLYESYNRMHLLPEGSSKYQKEIQELYNKYLTLFKSEHIGIIDKNLVNSAVSIIEFLLGKQEDESAPVFFNKQYDLQICFNEVYKDILGFSKTIGRQVIFGQELIYISEFLAVATSMVMFNLPLSVRLFKIFLKYL